MSQNKVRYHSLDELRGFMVLCMVFFHGFYLGGFAFGIEFLADIYFFFEPLEPIFAAGFIFICGLCTNFSRFPLKRGVLALIAAFAVTAVTLIMTFFGVNEPIYFGILHLLGVCLVLSAMLKKVLEKTGSPIIPSALFILFLLSYNLPEGYFGIGNLTVEVPNTVYELGFLFPLGFPPRYFSTGDYFPMIPWAIVFFCGATFGKTIKRKLPDFFEKSRIKPLSFMGRNALVFYLVHQPVWYGIFYLLQFVGVIK
jgi:uncharacterized membrane protein